MSEEDVDPFLWDRSGPPDPEMRRLEDLLSRYRWRGGRELPGVRRPRRYLGRRTSGIGAALAAGLAAAVILWCSQRGASVGGYRVVGIAGRDLVRAGEHLTTGGAERARLDIGGLGHVDVEPNSRLEVADCGADGHRLFLSRGSIAARIWAAPRVFRIDSPAGDTIDLGCAYTLDVAADGSTSTLRVTSGQVAFEFDGREIYVPAGATCASVQGRGLAAPVFESASSAFKAALAQVEFAKPSDPEAVRKLIELSARSDTLTLWHLFTSERSDPVLRRSAYEKLSSVFEKPDDPRITEQGLFAGDPAMRAAWMEEMKPAWR